MEILEVLLTPNRYNRPEAALKAVKGVVVHYVGNPGSSARSTRDYFEDLKESGNTHASCHYIIGLEGEIIRCVPENEIAFCSNYRNTDTIGIECCHPKKDGQLNDKTYQSLVELITDICKRYGLNPLENIVRHYDLTRTLCPLWFVNHPDDWLKLKNDIRNKLNGNDIITAELSDAVTEAKVIIDGTEYTVNRILKNGRNYIELQSLTKAGYKVSDDTDSKVPAIYAPDK